MSTIFNKNHITINKYKVLTRKKDSKLRIDFIRNYGVKTSYRYNLVETIKIKKKSKLGFWYWAEQKIYDTPKYNINKVILNLGNVAYDIIYPFKSKTNQYINTDIRPWEIVSGDGPFDEHYMHDLENDINNILNDILECSGTIEYTNRYYNSLDMPSIKEMKPQTIYRELKNLLFTDLFGNKNGIRFQTDSEKLLSHGFDIKMSFRKRKEE